MNYGPWAMTHASRLPTHGPGFRKLSKIFFSLELGACCLRLAACSLALGACGLQLGAWSLDLLAGSHEPRPIAHGACRF